MKKHIGPLSLVIAIGGMVLIQVSMHAFLLQGWIWRVLLAGFTAGTVGGIADWFAVQALFHNIPIPVIRRHTNIIVNNRNRLIEGIVDLVTNKWLGPDMLKEKIAELDIIKPLLDLVDEPGNQDKLTNVLNIFLGDIIETINPSDTISFLGNMLRKPFAELEMAKPIGDWLKKAIRNGDHRKILNLMFEVFLTIINHEETRRSILLLIEQRTDEYKRENILKRLFVNLGQQAGIFDNDSIVDKLVSLANDFILSAKNDQSHVINQGFDKFLISFANKLSDRKKDQFSALNDFKQQLFGNPDIKNICLELLTNFKNHLKTELKTPESSVVNSIANFVKNLISNIKQNQTTQKRIEDVIKKSLSLIITRHYKGIGTIIRQSLLKLSDEELVTQIKDKVGDDLQYIRLNGSIVGGIAGMVIYIIQSI